MRRRRFVAGALMAVVLPVASCGGSGTGREEVRVYAASSLTDALKEAAAAYRAEHRDASIRLTFGSSSALAVQLVEGAPGDVFISADLAQMAVVEGAGLVAQSWPLATNSLVVVATSTAAGALDDFSGLARPGLRLVLAAEDVPAGRYAREALARASQPTASGGLGTDFAERVLRNVRSNEPTVRAVLTKVELGEADAGIVYRTDPGAALDSIRILDIPAAFNITAVYPVALLRRGMDRPAVGDWVAYLRSPAGKAVLARYGFGAPPQGVTLAPPPFGRPERAL